MAAFQITFSVDPETQESVSREIPFKRERKQAACNRCRKAHRKCQLTNPGDESCTRCLKARVKCIWEAQSKPPSGSHSTRSVSPQQDAESTKRQKLTSLVDNEHIYAKVLQKSKLSSQFITSTQPLAPILSRDSLLCLDGEILGLFNPWRDIYSEPRDRYGNKIDKELHNYLTKKGAFIVPHVAEQRKLIQLYLNNLYPFYPVVQRDVLSDLSKLPLMLLNAIMLAGVRYDPNLKDTEFRIRAEEFRIRCTLLKMIETNKVTLLQSYLLLSLNEEGPEGPSFSREYSSKAVILSLELGLQVHSASEQFDMLKNIDDVEKDTASKLNYNKGLMVRLFWTSFCCDRTSAVTSCTSMLYNTSDMRIDEPSLKDFDIGEYQEHDFQLFNKWLGSTKLFERVLMKVYRPPGKRSLEDTTLEMDLLDWDETDLSLNTDPKLIRFLKTVHAYNNLLYLRCKIGFLDLIEIKTSPPTITDGKNSLPLTTAGMYYVSKFSEEIMKNLSHDDNIEHIINTHVLLHVLVLIHLEIESKKQVHEENESYMNQITIDGLLDQRQAQFGKCLALLEKSKKKWWFSAAAYHLFNTLTEQKSNAPSSVKFNPGMLESIFIHQSELNPELFNEEIY